MLHLDHVSDLSTGEKNETYTYFEMIFNVTAFTHKQKINFLFCQTIELWFRVEQNNNCFDLKSFTMQNKYIWHTLLVLLFVTSFGRCSDQNETQSWSDSARKTHIAFLDTNVVSLTWWFMCEILSRTMLLTWKVWATMESGRNSSYILNMLFIATRSHVSNNSNTGQVNIVVVFFLHHRIKAMCFSCRNWLVLRYYW